MPDRAQTGRNRSLDRLITTAREPTAAERVAASRVVLKQARSRADLRDLLEALGLTSKDTSHGA